MKKIVTGILTATLIFTLGTATTFAAAPGRTACKAANTGRKLHFLDSNNDGVCDYLNLKRQFIDENNDGVCDNQTQQTGSGQCDGTGQQIGSGQQAGNGTCDGTGQQKGHKGGHNR